MSSRVKGRLPKADGRVCIGASLGGTMMQIAVCVHLYMGPLRVSAALLVTFGDKSHAQRAKFDTLSKYIFYYLTIGERDC